MRWTTVFLIFLLVFPGAVFGKTDKPRGNKAVVRTAQGKYQGTLLFIDSELLVLKEKKSEELLGFSTPQLEKVQIRKSKAVIGIAAGLAVGMGVIGIIVLCTPKKADSFGSALGNVLLIGAAIGAAIILSVFVAVGGGILGSLVGWKRFKFNKMNEIEKEAALKRLQGYALLGELPMEMRTRLVMVTK